MLNKYRSQSHLTRAYLQMHLSIILWGATAVLGKSIELREGMLVWYRLIITSVSLLVFVSLTKKNLRVSPKNFGWLVFIGILLMVHWLFFYGAIKFSNVSVTLSLFSSTTLFTALIEPAITKKKFDSSEILFSIIAMSGIGLIYYSDTNSYSTGIVLALLAAFVGAFFNILNKRVVNEIPSDVVSLYEIISGLLVLTVFLPLYIHVFNPPKLIPSGLDLPLLFVLAVFCTHVPLMLSLNALKYLSAFTLNLSINLEPVYGIALAFFIFHENEHLNAGFFVGTALIMLSVIMHSYFANKRTQ